MGIHFSSGRDKFTEDVWCFTITPNEGNLLAGNYYFSIQGRNRVGLNLPLVSNLISIPENSSLTITFKNNIYASGENWYDLILSISTTPNLEDFNQIVAIHLKDNDNFLFSPFPLDLIFTDSNDFQVDKEYCNINDIDDTDFKNGKIIKLTSTNLLYEFYKDCYLEEEEQNLENFNSTLGCFKKVFSSNKNITNIEDYGGANLDVRSDLTLLEYFKFSEYTIDSTDSDYLKFTISNTTGGIIPANCVMSIESLINNQNGNSYLQNCIFVIFRGFINLTTGELRTTSELGNPLNYINSVIPYNTSSPNLFLPDNLYPNEGFILDIFINISEINLSNIFLDNSQIFLYPLLYTNFIRYSPLYEIFTEGVIANKPDYCFLTPLEDGNILLKRGEIIFKGYSIIRNLEEEFLLQNNQEQYLNINYQGIIQSIDTNITLPFNSVNLAKINCLEGKSKISNKIVITLNSTRSLVFTLNLPVVNEEIKVRSDYTNKYLIDKYIGFPTLNLEIYVKKPDETIIKIPYFIEKLETQTVELTYLPTTEIIESNINTSTVFGLINSPILKSSTSGVGAIPSGSYEIYCSFIYSGLEVTDILETLPIFDLNNLGTGSGQVDYSITTINSSSNLLLNLQNSLNYEINIIGNCNLENPVNYKVGSVINILFKQDVEGNNQVTFSNFWNFNTVNPQVSLLSEAITYLQGLVTETGIYCTLNYPYFSDGVFRIPFGNNFPLNNILPLDNAGAEPLTSEGSSQLLNASQLTNNNQLIN